MPNLRSVRLALWIVVALALVLPASASGAVTIGSDLEASADKSLLCTDACTVSSAALPVTSQASGGRIAPSDGVVVRWRIKVGATTTPVALRITRPGASEEAQRTGAGTGPTVTPEINRTSTFDVRLPIQAGDALGIDCCLNQPMQSFVTTPNADLIGWRPPLVEGEPLRTLDFATADLELLINADVEPDADGDGFGDETQDQCPGAPGNADGCDRTPPETTITKGAPNRTDKTKVKIKFESDEPGSTFECKLDKKKFKPCTSPRKVKNLDEGKHKFKARATDEAGNVDPTPAKDKFKVVG